MTTVSAGKWAATHAKIIELATPKFKFGRWVRPHLSRRKVAKLRKIFALAGVPFPEIPRPKKPGVISKIDRPPKGHRWQNEKQLRLAKIQENIEKSDKMLEELRKERRLETFHNRPEENFYLTPKEGADPISQAMLRRILVEKKPLNKELSQIAEIEPELLEYEMTYGPNAVATKTRMDFLFRKPKVKHLGLDLSYKRTTEKFRKEVRAAYQKWGEEVRKKNEAEIAALQNPTPPTEEDKTQQAQKDKKKDQQKDQKKGQQKDQKKDQQKDQKKDQQKKDQQKDQKENKDQNQKNQKTEAKKSLNDLD